MKTNANLKRKRGETTNHSLLASTENQVTPGCLHCWQVKCPRHAAYTGVEDLNNSPHADRFPLALWDLSDHLTMLRARALVSLIRWAESMGTENVG